MSFKTNLTAGLRSQTFTTGGAFVVPPGVTNLIVFGCGGGGGGGGGSGGNSYPGTCCGYTYMGGGGAGGGGVYPQSYNLSVTPGQTIQVNVGSGGAGGAGGGLSGLGANGAAGGNSEVIRTYPVNQVQRVSFNGLPVSGNWRVAFRGAITANIAWNATAATVQTAFQNLNTVGSGDVLVTRTGPTAFGYTYDITFQNNLGGYNWTQMTVYANPVGASTLTQILTPGSPGNSIIFEGGLGGPRGAEGTTGAYPLGGAGGDAVARSETALYTKRTRSGGGNTGGVGSSVYQPATADSVHPDDTPFSIGGENGVPQYHISGGGGGGPGLGNGGNGCQPYYQGFQVANEPASQFAKNGGYGAGGGGGCGDYGSGSLSSYKKGGNGGSGIIIIFY